MPGYKAHQEPFVSAPYKAYAPDGTFKGIVKLTWKRKAEFEARGFWFEKKNGSHSY